MNNITVKNIDINVTGIGDDDYISLTDLARLLNKDDPRYPICNWMSLKDTIEFVGLWEILNNDNFNRVEFDAFKNEAGKNSFVMTPSKWIRCTNAIGFKSKSGKYGGGTFLKATFRIFRIVQNEGKYQIIQEERLVSDYDLFIENTKIEDIPIIVKDKKK